MEAKQQNIVPVNLSEIDSELLELDTKIRALQTDRETLMSVRRFIASKANSNQPVVYPILDLGVSDYIISLLRKSNLEGRAIKLSYANAIGKTVKDISNNVGNALTRLKDKGEIDSVPNGKSKKAGSVYRLIKKD